MIEVNQTEFRKSIKKYTDMAIDEEKIIKITSSKHRNLIVMSEETFKTLLSNGGEVMDYSLYLVDKIQTIEYGDQKRNEAVLETYFNKLNDFEQGGGD